MICILLYVLTEPFLHVTRMNHTLAAPTILPDDLPL